MNDKRAQDVKSREEFDKQKFAAARAERAHYCRHHNITHETDVCPACAVDTIAGDAAVIEHEVQQTIKRYQLLTGQKVPDAAVAEIRAGYAGTTVERPATFQRCRRHGFDVTNKPCPACAVEGIETITDGGLNTPEGHVQSGVTIKQGGTK